MPSDNEARRLSSAATYFYKYLFPPLFLLVPVGGLIFISTTTRAPLPLPALLVPVFMIVIGLILFRRLFWNLADEVIDEGGFLIVRVGRLEERVQIRDIMNVGFTPMINPPRITLRLVDGHVLGREVSFLPKRRLFESAVGENAIANELIERVYALRHGRTAP